MRSLYVLPSLEKDIQSNVELLDHIAMVIINIKIHDGFLILLYCLDAKKKSKMKQKLLVFIITT